MIEKALLLALVATGVVLAASAISDGIEVTADRIQCGLDRAAVCILDDAKEG